MQTFSGNKCFWNVKPFAKSLLTYPCLISRNINQKFPLQSIFLLGPNFILYIYFPTICTCFSAGVAPVQLLTTYGAILLCSLFNNNYISICKSCVKFDHHFPFSKFYQYTSIPFASSYELCPSISEVLHSVIFFILFTKRHLRLIPLLWQKQMHEISYISCQWTKARPENVKKTHK